MRTAILLASAALFVCATAFAQTATTPLERVSVSPTFYPTRAADRRLDGEVTLCCAVGEDGSLACEPSSETPRGQHFSEAALAIARQTKLRADAVPGLRAEGQPLKTVTRFDASGSHVIELAISVEFAGVCAPPGQ